MQLQSFPTRILQFIAQRGLGLRSVPRNKLFFFQSTKWTHVRSPAPESELIRTPQFLALTAPSVRSCFGVFGSTPYAIGSTLTQQQLGVALGGNHDERRFGQFPLRFDF